MIGELCPECADRWRAHKRVLYAARRARHGGVVNRKVPPDRTAAAILSLRARYRMTLAEIADEAGVSKETLKRVLHSSKHKTGGRVWSTIERAVVDLRP